MKVTLVETVQTTLKAGGFDPGGIDGVWGPLTRAAVEDWQRKHDLNPSGELDAATLASLGVQQRPPVLWVDEAVRLLGLREGRGPNDNPTILDWADDLELNFPHDDIAWCGLFMAHVIRTALPREALPNNPLGARNWQKFGKSVKPQFGAIAPFWRGSRDGWQGHVGILVAESDRAYGVLGGNQSDRVSYAWIAKDRLLDARWPTTGLQPMNIKLPRQPGGELSTNEA